MSAGSLIDEARENCVVWGSGILTRDASCRPPARVHAVRGPRTRQRLLALGIDCPACFGDPGLLLPAVSGVTRQPVEARLGIVPHFRDRPGAAAVFNNQQDVFLIDVRYPVEEVLRNIASCEAVVSSSLHGVIVAHALGVPVVWAELGGNLRGDGVKFLDHFEAVGISKPQRLESGLTRSAAQLREASLDAPRPVVASLLEPLLRACPFPVDHEVMASVLRRLQSDSKD